MHLGSRKPNTRCLPSDELRLVLYLASQVLIPSALRKPHIADLSAGHGRANFIFAQLPPRGRAHCPPLARAHVRAFLTDAFVLAEPAKKPP